MKISHYNMKTWRAARITAPVGGVRTLGQPYLEKQR